MSDSQTETHAAPVVEAPQEEVKTEEKKEPEAPPVRRGPFVKEIADMTVQDRLRAVCNLMVQRPEVLKIPDLDAKILKAFAPSHPNKVKVWITTPNGIESTVMWMTLDEFKAVTEVNPVLFRVPVLPEVGSNLKRFRVIRWTDLKDVTVEDDHSSVERTVSAYPRNKDPNRREPMEGIIMQCMEAMYGVVLPDSYVENINQPTPIDPNLTVQDALGIDVGNNDASAPVTGDVGGVDPFVIAVMRQVFKRWTTGAWYMGGDIVARVTQLAYITKLKSKHAADFDPDVKKAVQEVTKFADQITAVLRNGAPELSLKLVPNTHPKPIAPMLVRAAARKVDPSQRENQARLLRQYLATLKPEETLPFIHDFALHQVGTAVVMAQEPQPTDKASEEIAVMKKAHDQLSAMVKTEGYVKFVTEGGAKWRDWVAGVAIAVPLWK